MAPEAKDPAANLMTGLEGFVVIYNQLNRQPAQAGNLSTAEERYAIRATSLPDGLQMTALRPKTRYPKASFSRVTSKLEKYGFLQTNIDRANGRYRILRATAQGKLALSRLDQKAFKVFQSRESELAGRLSELLDLLQPFAGPVYKSKSEGQGKPAVQQKKDHRSKSRKPPLAEGQTSLTFPDMLKT